MSHCPHEIFSVVTKILHLGLVSLRQATWTGGGVDLTAYVRAETDHLHNLPDLFHGFSPQKFDYLTAEMPDYEQVIAQIADANSCVQETQAKCRPLWEQLQEWWSLNALAD